MATAKMCSVLLLCCWLAVTSTGAVYPPSSYSTHDHHHHGYNKVPKYGFGYTVRDDHYGPNFGASETRDGYGTEGSYFVDLPDGRRQKVTYYVTKDSGYVADVTYEKIGAVKGDYSHGGYESPPTSKVSSYHKSAAYDGHHRHHHREPEPSYHSSSSRVHRSSGEYVHRAPRTHAVYLKRQPIYETKVAKSYGEQNSRYSHRVHHKPEPVHLHDTHGYKSSEQNYHSSEEAYGELKSKTLYDMHHDPVFGKSSHAFHQQPSKISNSYQEIPAPKPVFLTSTSTRSSIRSDSPYNNDYIDRMDDSRRRSLSDHFSIESSRRLRGKKDVSEGRTSNRYGNVGFFSSGGSYFTPRSHFIPHSKPPLVRSLKEVEQYNIDAAEYI